MRASFAGLFWLLLVRPAAADAQAAACIAAHADGQVLRSAGNLTAARAKFNTCSVPSCPDLVRTDCAAFADAVERTLPTLWLSASEADGRPIANFKAEVDGKILAADELERALPIDPGQHRFRFTTLDRRTLETTFVIREGEKNRKLAVRFPALEEPDRARNYASLALAGIGVGALASFTVFGFNGLRLENELEACAPNCQDRELARRMRSHYLIADISLGVSLASLGTAAYLMFSGATRKAVAAEPRSALSVDAGQGSLGVSARGSF